MIYFVRSSFHSKLQRFEMTAFELLLLKSALGITLWNWLLFTKTNCKLFRGNNILFCVYAAFNIKIQIVGTFCPVVFLDYSHRQSSSCTWVMLFKAWHWTGIGRSGNIRVNLTCTALTPTSSHSVINHRWTCDSLIKVTKTLDL